jgi:hypothetical protein
VGGYVKKGDNNRGRKSSYKKEYCNKIRDFFKDDEKATLASFARSLDVDPATVYEWANQYPEFYESKNKALQNKKENLVHMIQDLVVTGNDVKVNSVPLVLLARNFGIATSDNAKNNEKDTKEEDFSNAIDD